MAHNASNAHNPASARMAALVASPVDQALRVRDARRFEQVRAAFRARVRRERVLARDAREQVCAAGVPVSLAHVARGGAR